MQMIFFKDIEVQMNRYKAQTPQPHILKTRTPAAALAIAMLLDWACQGADLRWHRPGLWFLMALRNLLNTR